uniref:PUM-HD domain-containing protein n=1 Tax=Parastrongyloides trichosuri TaxID=131310 RepID=A0A0N5A1J7_PARTI
MNNTVNKYNYHENSKSLYKNLNHYNNRRDGTIIDKIRIGKGYELNIDDIKENIETFSMDRYGSRFIQTRYEASNKDEKIDIFLCLLPHAIKLSQDIFGNYVIQKIITSSNEKQIKQLLNAISGSVLVLALNQYGCRVIQKAIEFCDYDGNVIIFNEIKKDILKCTCNEHGNHVIQKMIPKLSKEYHRYIVDSILKNDNLLYEISLNQYGCRVIQVMIEKFDGENKELLMEKLQKILKPLILNEFGNYVAQKMFVYGNAIDKQLILTCIRNDLLNFSRNKYASNVIEICLEKGSSDDIELITKKVITEPFDKIFYPMIGDQYGNYVIQKMLDKSNTVTKKKLISGIKPMKDQFTKQSFYRNILLKAQLQDK